MSCSDDDDAEQAGSRGTQRRLGAASSGLPLQRCTCIVMLHTVPLSVIWLISWSNNELERSR